MKHKKKKISKKGVMKSTIISIILGVAFFVIIITIFFGEGLLPTLFNSIKEKINGVPEVDPSKDQLNFVQNQYTQLRYLKSLHSSMQSAILSEASAGGCLKDLPSLDQDGFYGGAYSLYIDQTGPSTITLRLINDLGQDYESGNEKTPAPVAVMTLEGAQLCVIAGTNGNDFYNEFNEIKSGEVPNPTKIYPTPVESLIISAVRAGGVKREIGYRSAGQTTYTWHTFFKKGSKTTLYTLRVDVHNEKHLCFFPLSSDTFSGCSKPSSGTGIADEDCFDLDKGEKSIPYNIDKGLIPAQLVCGDMTLKNPDCQCGGTMRTDGNCDSEFSIEQCQCASKLAKEKYEADTGKPFGSQFIAHQGGPGKKCYYSTQGCEYLLKAKPDFLNLIKAKPDECPG